MLIPISLIHQVYTTLGVDYSASGNTCELLVPGSSNCVNCPACLHNARPGHNCGFTEADNPDYTQSLEAYYQVYPESLI